MANSHGERIFYYILLLSLIVLILMIYKTGILTFSLTNQYKTGFTILKKTCIEGQLRVRTVAKRHMRFSIFTASFILVSGVKLPQFLE